MDRYIFKYLDRLIWKKAKYVVANSEGLRDLAYKSYDKKKIEVIYNGVKSKKELPEKTEKKFVVVSTSRLIERKGIKYLIEAFNDFCKSKDDVELRLYGGGNQEDMLKNMAKGYGIDDKVRFYGEVEREIIYKEIVQCSVFVLPSNNEGMSNSLLEAMAHGLPIIATDVGGTKELVDESNGFVIRKANIQDISESLEKLYKDKEMLERMGMNSRKKAMEMSWENMSKKYVEIYNKIT